MSQHMHDMTSDDHVLTRAAAVPRRRAQYPDHAGAAARRDRDACIRASRRTRRSPRSRADRPTLDGAGAGDHAGADRASALGGDRPVLAARGHHRLDAGAAAADRRFVARGVPVLQVYGSTETCPIAVYTRARRRSVAAVGSTGLPGLLCEATHRRRRGPRGAARHGRRGGGARAQRVLRILGQRASDRARRCATAGTIPATSARAMPTAISTSTTARRT